MSPQATQPGASELDANIDALFNQLEPGAAGGASGAVSAAGEPPVMRETALDPVMNTPVQAPIESPMRAADDMSALAGAEATAGNPEQPDAMLAEVSQEIEREAPRAMPAPVSPAPVIPAPSSEEMDLESAFEAPKPEELQVEPVAPVNRTAAAPSPVNIEKLDAALAENADKALAAAQDDLRKEAAAAPVAAPVVAPAPAPAPAPAKAPAPAPAKAVEPEEVIPELPDDPREVATAHSPAAAEVVEPKTPLAERLLTPLRPLAAIHERLGESTRQTIAYSAILTIFAAACAWTLPRFARGGELQPATGETPFITGYNDTVPAHGVKAPAKPHAEEKKAEGGEGGGHGEAAKKDSHAKAPSKKAASGGHGEEGGHAAEKPKKAPKSSTKGKAEEHGGGH